MESTQENTKTATETVNCNLNARKMVSLNQNNNWCDDKQLYISLIDNLSLPNERFFIDLRYYNRKHPGNCFESDNSSGILLSADQFEFVYKALSEHWKPSHKLDSGVEVITIDRINEPFLITINKATTSNGIQSVRGVTLEKEEFISLMQCANHFMDKL
jgi:hypothetical protein